MATLTMSQIGAYAYAAGFKTESKLAHAMAIAMGESGGRTDVVNYLGCTGLMQIYVKVHIKAHPTWTTKAMKQPYNNMKAAYVLSNGGTNWRPWEVYTRGMHKKYMGAATRIAKQIIAAKGGKIPGGTTGNTAAPRGPSLAKTLALAASQIGYVESGNNRTKYWAELAPRMQGGAWCGAFVAWVLKKNGIDMWKLGCSNPFYTPTIGAWAKKTGRWTSTPRPGYLVLFNFGKGRISHVGIVEKVLSGGYVQTIEGNTSGSSRGSQNNGGGVWRKKRKSGIVCYVKITYDTSSAPESRLQLPEWKADVPLLVDAGGGLGAATFDPIKGTYTLNSSQSNAKPVPAVWNQAAMDKLADITRMPRPYTSTKAYWRWIEEWCGMEGKWVDGELDTETIQAIQWRTNQAVIDGNWNSRTIAGILAYMDQNDL